MSMNFKDTASKEMQKLVDVGWDKEFDSFAAVQILCEELRKHGRDNLVDLFDKVAKRDLEPFGMGAVGGPQWDEASTWGEAPEADAVLESLDESKAPKDRFDLEQDIFKCWHIVDDIDHVAELIMDRNASKDTISNILIGLSALYGDRFQKLMDNFEKIIANGKI
jgi:hypothetical protein